MIVCWAAKGGSGATVTATALALFVARSSTAMLIDLAGDAAAAAGVGEPVGPGLSEWMCSASATPDTLAQLPSSVGESALRLLPRGDAAVRPEVWLDVARATRAIAAVTVVDAGTGAPPCELTEVADTSLLVIRGCYLALRRAARVTPPPDGVVLVAEPGRALRARDVESALGAPVVAELPVDPAVARAVDAGLLISRLPWGVQREVARLSAWALARPGRIPVAASR